MTLNISNLFSSLKARLMGQEAQPAARQDLVKLSRVLGVTGHRAGGSKDFQLVATEIGQDQILFKGGVKVREGEKLEIEMALPGLDTVKAVATVGWVIHSSKAYTGQLTLATTPAQRGAMLEYVRRQKFAQG